MINKIKSIFLKSWFIALIISAVIIAFIPSTFEKYKIDIVKEGVLPMLHNQKTYTHDLNGDGFSEYIISFEHNGKHSVQVLTWDGGVIDQWNTIGEMFGSRYDRVACGDYNNDGIEEVYTFYEIADTVFLFSFEPLGSLSNVNIERRPVCALIHDYSEPDGYADHVQLQDLNNDGFKDLFFIINSGMARFPRNLFIYDIKNDSLIVSPKIGSITNSSASITDLNNDGYLEITGSCVAPGQVHDSLGYKYSDYSAWLLVYDHELNFLFEPMEFPGITSALFVAPVKIDSSNLLACYYNHRGPYDNFPKLFLVNYNGDIVNELNFPKSEKVHRGFFLTTNNNQELFNICSENGYVSVFNKELKLLYDIDLETNVSIIPIIRDLNLDGSDEYVFQTLDRKRVLITDKNYRNPATIEHTLPNLAQMSIVLNGDKSPTLFLNNGKEFVELKYSANPLYYLRFLIYIGVFLSVWLLIQIIRKLQLIQIEKQQKVKSEIKNLQIKSFRNQMDPHFTFNAFNAISNKIHDESPESYEAFMEFSKLIRSTLISSEKITRTIQEEVSHLESYLKLEKKRFPDKLNYSININEEVDCNMKVPKMLLQTYVENSIKHGIRHKETSGHVNITISKYNHYIEFIIKDNGVGRKMAKQYSTDSTGFGLRIMENYFNLFNESSKVKIKHEITDLYDSNNNPAGTKVVVKIPLNFKMND